MSADWGVARDGGRGIVVGWALLAALVRAVFVVVPDELVEHRDGVRDHSQRLYFLLVLHEWLNQQ